MVEYLRWVALWWQYLDVEYIIVAEQDQGWVFEAEDFAERLRSKWPEVRIGIDDLQGSPMRLHALIPYPPPQHELGIALADTGDGISLDPADPDTAAEFVIWLISHITDFSVPLNISGTSEWRPLPLMPDTTEQDVIRHLESF